MTKLYFPFLLVFIFFTNKLAAQAPAISYQTPQAFIAGKPITPLNVTNTGAAFPQGMYGKVSIIAGDGYYGFANGNVSEARFANPLGIVGDANGNIFIADANNNIIRKITKDGTVSTYAGNGEQGLADGPATDAQFNYPSTLGIDAAGNMYITDSGNNRVRKITSAGVVSTVGDSTSFNFPFGIAVTPAGTVYVSNTYSNNIKKITPTGVISLFAGSSTGNMGKNNGNGANARFWLPFGITLDHSENLFVSEFFAVRKITPAGDVTGAMAIPYQGVDVAIDGMGNIYSTDSTTNGILKINPLDQTHIQLFAGRQSNTDTTITAVSGTYHGIDASASLSVRMNMFYDNNGNLLITDPAHSQIKKVSLTGYYLQEPLPKGIVFDYSTGTISGIPVETTPSTDYHILAYTATAVDTTTINISVGKGQQILAFDPVPAKTYGEADFSPAVTNNNGDPIIYTSSDTTIIKVVNNKLHMVKAGKSTITANQPANATFSASATLSQPITVNPAVLTVGVYNTTKAFGQADPKLFLKYDGFKNNDDTLSLTTQPVAKSATTATSPAADYPINISGGVSDRYTFNFVPGVMTVFPLPVITAANGVSSFKLGDSVLLSVNPATGYSYQWYLNAAPVTGATSSTFMAKQGGYYAVSINANDFTNYSATLQLTGTFFLPVDNFKITITSAACKGDNNGSLKITPKQTMNYVANIVGPNNFNSTYNFTDNLDVTGLVPGSYSICISVPGQNYSQCFSAVVTEPQDLSVYTAINKTLNTVNLNMEGAGNYTILLNDKTYNTTAGNITLPLTAGNNKLTVTTDKLCQGVFEKTIIVADKIIPYPNPFRDQLSINLGNNNTGFARVTIIDAISGKLVYSDSYTNKQGVVQIDVSSLKMGMYVLNLSLENNNDLLFKLLKK